LIYTLEILQEVHANQGAVVGAGVQNVGKQRCAQ
jgi:hypothetical protein